jgi:hypothetical protein
MLGLTIAFCFFLLCFLCIATLIRGWKAYCVIVVLLPTFAILIPFAPSSTAVLVWYFTVIAPLIVMIFYGNRGRKAFERFVSNDIGKRGEELIERFQNWNQ